MMKFSALAGLCSRLASFRKDEGGNALMLFGLSLIPVVGLVGAASDYSRAATAKTEMQTAVDAVALMVSREALGLTASQVQLKANTYFKGMFKRADVDQVQLTATYAITQGSRVSITTSGQMKTYFMGILGQNDMTIHAAGTSVWGQSRLRVALVLDNSGSMASSGKIAALKTASHNLLTQLKTAAVNTQDVYVSIVPFSATVNVGPLKSNQLLGPISTALWTNWTDYGSCAKVTTSRGVTTTTQQPSLFSKTLCQASSYTWTPAINYSAWEGCVGDRTSPNDANFTPAVLGLTATYYWANKYESCNAGLSPLTNDWVALNAKIDEMSPSGNTNQAIGMQWGMTTLWGSAPATAPSREPNYQYSDVIILMTDGDNTSSRTTTSQATIDSRTTAACTAAKANNAIVYAIEVDTEGGSQNTMLKNCATDSSRYFYMDDAADLVSVFDQIGTAISKLRIES